MSTVAGSHFIVQFNTPCIVRRKPVMVTKAYKITGFKFEELELSRVANVKNYVYCQTLLLLRRLLLKCQRRNMQPHLALKGLQVHALNAFGDLITTFDYANCISAARDVNNIHSMTLQSDAFTFLASGIAIQQHNERVNIPRN